MRSFTWVNHHRLICVSTMPLPGMPSGRITSNAESRSVAEVARPDPGVIAPRRADDDGCRRRTGEIDVGPWICGAQRRGESLSQGIDEAGRRVAEEAPEDDREEDRSKDRVAFSFGIRAITSDHPFGETPVDEPQREPDDHHADRAR